MLLDLNEPAESLYSHSTIVSPGYDNPALFLSLSSLEDSLGSCYDRHGTNILSSRSGYTYPQSTSNADRRGDVDRDDIKNLFHIGISSL